MNTSSERNHDAANNRDCCSVQPCEWIRIDETAFIEAQMAAMGKFHVQCVAVFA